MKMSILVAALVVPSVALAGSDNRVCQTADKSVVMHDGDRITIKLADRSTFETTVSMPMTMVVKTPTSVHTWGSVNCTTSSLWSKCPLRCQDPQRAPPASGENRTQRRAWGRDC